MLLLEDPGTARAHRRDRHPDHERTDLTGIEKCQTKEPNWEEEAEEKQERARHGNAGDIWCSRCCSGDDGHASPHADRRDHHQLPSPKAIHRENADRRATSLEGEERCCQYPSHRSGETEVLFENRRLVERDRIDSRELLEHLTSTRQTGPVR